MNKKYLKEYIEYLVENILSEEEGLDLTPPEDNSAEDNSSTTEDDTELDLGTDSDTADGNDTTDTTDDSGLDLGDEGDSSLDFGSGGGSGGFSGGGGGSFDFSSSGNEKTETQNDNTDLQVQTQPVELQDPTKETVEMAKKLSGMVGDIQTIVNAVKSNIQSYYEDPADAVEIVQELWDSDNPKLRLTAIKLLMFIRGY